MAPRAFKATVSRLAPQFAGSAQHDAHDLLEFMMGGLHEDLNRVGTKRYIPVRLQACAFYVMFYQPLVAPTAVQGRVAHTATCLLVHRNNCHHAHCC